jgi:hypothetical protein
LGNVEAPTHLNCPYILYSRHAGARAAGVIGLGAVRIKIRDAKGARTRIAVILTIRYLKWNNRKSQQ